MNAIVFSYSLRISPKEYDELMAGYPEIISDLLIQIAEVSKKLKNQ
jgi:hypothetical protein